MRGSASRVRRSRKSHIRSPRRVTLTPIGLPVRTRNWAIDRLARVTIGFWPVMSWRSPTAASTAFAFCRASPEADVDDDLLDARHLVGVRVVELLAQRGHDLRRVPLLQLAAHDFTSMGSPQCLQIAHPGPVVERSMRDPGRAIAAGAHDHDPLDGERHGVVQDAARIDRGHGARAALRPLARLGVLAGDVEALDDHVDAALERRPAVAGADGRRRRVTPDDVLHLAALAGVAAGQHEHGVALADLGHLRRCSIDRVVITAPPGRARRSSCSCGPGARARRARRCGCRAGCPGC